MRVLVFGDSIVEGFWGVEGGWVERLRRHYDTLSVKDLTADSQPSMFNLGVGGDRSEQLLARIENETRSRKWKNDPQVLVIAIGTNDSGIRHGKREVPVEAFRTNLQFLVDKASQLSNQILLVGLNACDEQHTTPVYWDTGLHYTNQELARFEEAIKQVAEQNEVAFAPIFKDFKARLDNCEQLLEDGLHPNDSGHQLIVELVRPKLEEVING